MNISISKPNAVMYDAFLSHLNFEVDLSVFHLEITRVACLEYHKF